MGWHIIGYEVQKVLAAADRFEQQAARNPRVGVVGYGEGGLIGFYAAAMDERIDAALVSGYFGPREDLWKEPIYRNVWGLVRQFGDAEIASLIMPRPLVIEYSKEPNVEGPPPAQEGELAVAAPGRLKTPPLQAVQQEVERLRGFFPTGGDVQPDVRLVSGEGDQPTVGPGSEEALRLLLKQLDVGTLAEARTIPGDRRKPFDPAGRQKRQVQQLTDHLQEMVQLTDRKRYAFIEGNRSSPQAWNKSMRKYRTYFWEENMGRLPKPSLPPNPRMRKIWDRKTWTGYKVILDVWPDVFTFGILAVPKDLKPGEERPWSLHTYERKCQAHRSPSACGSCFSQDDLGAFECRQCGGSLPESLQRRARRARSSSI